MKIKLLKPESLTPYENNAKHHSTTQIELLQKSITQFGFNNPILIDENKVIIAGHGRHQAALELGLDKVPTIELSHLSEAERRAYILADNKLSEVGGGWNEDMLNFELGELGNIADFDLDVTGFIFESQEFTPELSPEYANNQITEDQVAKESKRVDAQGKQAPPRNEVMCPNCGHEFATS